MPSIQKLEVQVQDKAVAAATAMPSKAGNQQIERVKEIFHGEIVRQGGQT
jgi:hypothetical protein